MKTKIFTLLLCLSHFCVVCGEDFSLQLNTGSANQAEISYDATSGIYTIHTTGGDPFVSITALSSALPTNQCVLTFDYQCMPETTGGLQVFFGPTYSETRSLRCDDLANTTEWTTYSIEMKNAISNFGWGASGSVMRLDWGNRSDVTIQVKNLRFREMNEEEKNNYDITGNKEAMRQRKAEHLQNYLYTNAYASKVSHVKVDAEQVTISGKCDGIADFALVEVTPNIDVTECKKFAHRTTVSNGEFSVSLDRYASYDGFTYDRLLSKWAIVGNLGETDTLLSHARYADEVVAISSPERLVPANKKGVGAGLGETYMQDLVDLNAKNITCNWVFNQFIAQNPIFGNNIPYIYGGKQYYINGGEIDAWDHHLTFYEQHGIAVSAIVLIPIWASDPSMTPVLVHPDNNGGYYSMPNMTTMESVNAYAAILNYLASRYNGSGHGRIEHWIMHNEVDMATTWTNMGNPPEMVYIDEYLKSMRMCYNIVRQYDQNASVLGSYTHSWTYGADGYSTKNMLEQTVRYSQVEGDFWWGVAHHPYPQNLSKPDFWINDTQSTYNQKSSYVTFKNLEVINDWILADENRYQGSVKRNLFLSENGTNSPSYSETDLAHQAAGGCWAWKKANALEGIDAFMWHNWMDNRVEDGLRIGLHFFPDDADNPGGKKPVWYVWEAAASEREDEVMNPYKSILDITDWRDIFMLAEGEGRSLTSNKVYVFEAEDYDEGGLGVGYSARQGTTAGDYRPDSEQLSFWQGASYSGGIGIANMGADWNSYTLNKWLDESAKTISREMAEENWGCWLNYSFEAQTPLEVNISVHHGAVWSEWGVAAGTGYAPGSEHYIIAEEPNLNWPRQYAGAMVLALDGENLPTTQVARPIAPEAYQARGTNFNKVLTKPENWTSTLHDGALQTDTLWTWPLAGGNNTGSAYYSEEPDYRNIHISAGHHTLRLTSLCGPWHFDCLKIECFEPSAVVAITAPTALRLEVSQAGECLTICSEEPVSIFSIDGRCHATLPKGSHNKALNPGIYILRTPTQAMKVMVKP